MNKNKIDQEFSSGGVIYRKESDGFKFLIIYSKRNRSWGLPKGHIEPGETEIEAAEREIKEETGIDDLDFMTGFREEDVYEPVSNRGSSMGQKIEKHSVYFLAITKTDKIKVDADEIGDYRWSAIQEAESLLSFDSLKKIIRKAYEYLKTIPV